ncbi:MAG: patatin family protein [Coriobacteriia bacterium]|nr:patatin family protein [Coriobacteriia bacterium]
MNPPLPPQHQQQAYPQQFSGGVRPIQQHAQAPQLPPQQLYQHPQFKLPLIPGVFPHTFLPQGTALVLEGGGTRGFYSAGVMDAFAAAGIMFPYITAVSAGAANVLSYISGQRGRNRLVVEHLVHDPRYLSTKNLLQKGSLFDFDFIFNTVPRDYLYFDQAMFERVPTRLLTGTLDCREGRSVYYEKQALAPANFIPTIASCSIPLVSHMVRYDNRDLLDGGILDPIPIDRAIADKNKFYVIVLTQNAGYIKGPSSSTAVAWARYHRKYPHLVWAMQERHNAYNRQVELAQQLQREGRALIIRPQQPLHLSRTESDPAVLLELYDSGTREGFAALDALRRHFAF